MQKIVVVSDQHLGYAKSDATSFSAFLDSISHRSDVSDLVILGDFVDMWRRDASGVFLECHAILEKLLALQPSVEVYVVAGNHDYHLLQLKDHEYPFEAQQQDLVLDAGGSSEYKFLHGWEFDPAQQPLVMEALCHNLSDESGTMMSDVYAAISKVGSSLSSLVQSHGGSPGYVEHLMQIPEQRLQPSLSDVEKAAFSWQAKNGGTLVFGHTHRPFVSFDKMVVNTGSWVTDPPLHNTYAELSGDQPSLFVFNGEEITPAVSRPS